MEKIQYKRVLIKISGESFVGTDNQQIGVNFDVLDDIAKKIKKVVDSGIEVAIVVGGGNFWRGKEAQEKGMDRSTADYAGMLATIINALALQNILEKNGLIVRTQSSILMPIVAEPYIQRRAIRHLEKGRIVIFAAGMGNPYVTTDTAAALRAIDISADALLMAKNYVDGIYDSDPKKNPEAKKYDKLSHFEALNKKLGIMDLTALTFCMENQVPIIVFNLQEDGNLEKIMRGEDVGTLIK
ncbi:MAG: UMP kinase [Candidatus Pacebacteria bacterium]|nr:UMP kinase [Candidatus Paceibacterota bacterium]